MRMLIASDLHGSADSLRFLIGRATELAPDMVVLLGDLVYHGPRNPLPHGYDTIAVLDEMPTLADLPAPVCAVQGNCDSEVDVRLLPFSVTRNAWLDCDGLRIFASHGHLIPDNPPIPDMRPGTVILRGHTHIPRAETRGGLHFWNPGSLSLPKGGYPASYAVYEDGCFRVLDKNGREIMSHRPPRQGDISPSANGANRAGTSCGE